ncbi:ArsR/SmtB family transcription factor [Nonomuraea indica]|uniref:ArsR/SmtB family transcription factor n=1 Tax=Nonomuraea indica TaxID=1581193 RepID=A0ABW8ADT8_9ACTN
MFRIVFAETDLRRITVAPGPNAVYEAALSVRLSRIAPGGGRRWRPPGARHLQERRKGGLEARAGLLSELVRADGFVPDFLLQPDAHDFDGGLERIRQTPVEQLAVDLSPLPFFGRPSRSLLDLLSGTVAARQRLTDDMRGYFTSSLAPLWPEVQAGAAADRSLRTETLLRGGVDALLATLNVGWHWDPPVLRIPSHSSYEVPLCGRGLLLVPSYFAPAPMLGYPADGPVTLVYPMGHADRPSCSADALGPLLGRTRAAVMAALRDPATTTALAERVGISLASASQHATVLRNAGLISTIRIGGAVMHTITPLGTALLRGDTAVR